MSIFSKPLSQLQTSDLQELLTDKVVENVRLEFKPWLPDRDETLKKLSSFANTYGGYMVIGATEKDDRIEDLPGLDRRHDDKDKIVDWCFGGAYPPITVEVSNYIPTPSGNGKVCYVIHVRESDVAPHFLNGRKGVWVRTDDRSQHFEARLAEERELRELFDNRKVILERRSALLDRARKRFDAYIAKGHTDAGGHRTRVGPQLEICAVPRFPSRALIDHSGLRTPIMSKLLDWRQGKFPGLGCTFVYQHESMVVLDAAGKSSSSFVEANVFGMMFYRSKIAGSVNVAQVYGIPLFPFVGRLLLYVRHAALILRELGYAGQIRIETGMTSMNGEKWLYDAGGGIGEKPNPALDNDFSFSTETDSETLHQNPDDVAADLLRVIFFSVDWADLVDTPQKLADVIHRGYQANFW